MESELTNILKSICALIGNDLAYILECSGSKNSIIKSYGTVNTSDKNFSAFNYLLSGSKIISDSSLKQTNEFKSILKKQGLKYFYKKKIYKLGNVNYYLIIFSHSKLPSLKNIEIKIFMQINLLKTVLSVNKKIELSNNYAKTTATDLQQNIVDTIADVQIILYSINAKDFKFDFITEAIRNLFGYLPEEIYKSKYLFLKSIHKDDFKKFKNFIGTLKNSTEAVVEYRVHDRFGKEHWVRHTGFPVIKNGIILRFVGVVNDITEEKLVQLKLVHSEERFRALIDTAEDLIFTLDGFGYFNMVNKSGVNLLGYNPEEMVGKHFLEFINKDDEAGVAEAFTKILHFTGITTFEAVFLDRFNKEITFEINAKPLYDNGQVSGVLCIGRNISSRKIDEYKIRELNTKLIEASRIISIERERVKHKINVLEELNKLKSEFISNVSHELRTPLASIVGFAETIMSDQGLSKETIHEFSEIILSEGKRLAKLIDNLLDFSKLESGQDELQKTDIRVIKVIEEVLQTLSQQIKEKKLTLSKFFPEEDPIINADKERIEKVFWNLIANSIKFTNPGGRISLIVQDFGKEVEIVVSDTGIGISEKDLPYLFQKFSKVPRPGAPIGGTGIGLVIVKQIVDLHKGFIKIRSELNKGTTFLIRLPK
jgi:PAS domain S-box-containing protein